MSLLESELEQRYIKAIIIIIIIIITGSKPLSSKIKIDVLGLT